MKSDLNSICAYCGSPAPEGEAYCCQGCQALAQTEGPAANPSIALANEFEFLDEEDFRRLYRVNPWDPNSELYHFHVEGLHCSSCVHLIEKLPEFDPSCLESRVNFAQSTVTVELKDGGSLANTAQILLELGYRPSLSQQEQSLQQQQILENRTFLKRIAVAGFVAGNTMLFVIPVYAGLVGTWEKIFNFISFLLFLPILFYSAVPFYKGALNSLKYKVISADLPITIAMLSGFLLSTVNLIRGNGAIYYDSTASFMFFILSARYLLKRVQQHYLATPHTETQFINERYWKLSDEGRKSIPWDRALPGDIIEVGKRQNIPADGILMSENASIDMSLLNGESLPRTFSKNMKVFAGTKLLSEKALVRIESSFSESKLGKLIHDLNNGKQSKSHFVALSDKLAQILIVTVFSIAILFFLAYMHINVEEAMNRALALIVLACPCALAFGSPLTFGMAVKKAQSLGILIRNSSSLERINNIEHLFFDKTGTLTEGFLKFSHSEPSLLSNDLKEKIVSLEAFSSHPIAFALREAWAHGVHQRSVEFPEEIVGQGVRGLIEGVRFEIRSLENSEHSEISVQVLQDGSPVAKLYFVDQVRSDAKETIAYFQAMGIETHLISGDRTSIVSEIANETGIPLKNALGDLMPEDKLRLVAQSAHSCMIGDGANDALAIQSADVGIAMKGSVDMSKQNADIYFLKGGLAPLKDLFQISALTKKVLIRNLTISLIYNFIGGALSLMGFIDPMMAAILMPVSSIAIIGSSVWGFK